MIEISNQLENIAALIEIPYIRATSLEDANLLIHRIDTAGGVLVYAGFSPVSNYYEGPSTYKDVAVTCYIAINKLTKDDTATAIDAQREKAERAAAFIVQNFEARRPILKYDLEPTDQFDDLLTGYKLDFVAELDGQVCINIGPIYSPEVADMLQVYETLGTPLAGDELDGMVAYVDAEVAAGNHYHKDYELILPLSGVNALIDYKGSKIATNNGAVLSVEGATFAGAQNINANWTPAANGINYKQDDAQIGFFVKEYTESQNDEFLNDTTFGILGTSIRQRTGGNLQVQLNSNTPSQANGVLLTGDDLVYIRRNNAANFNVVKNGVVITLVTDVSTGLPTQATSIGGVSPNMTGTLSTFMAGGVLTDQAAHYNNLIALLTKLGTI